MSRRGRAGEVEGIEMMVALPQPGRSFIYPFVDSTASNELPGVLVKAKCDRRILDQHSTSGRTGETCERGRCVGGSVGGAALIGSEVQVARTEPITRRHLPCQHVVAGT